MLSKNENMNPDAKISDQDDDGEIFEFRPILRFDGTNSMVHEKNNLKFKRVPKMGIFYKILLIVLTS